MHLHARHREKLDGNPVPVVQRMQRLADELAAEGLVEFIDNPRHRRSKLVRPTRKGDARYRELSARFLAIASTMGRRAERGGHS